MPSKPDATCRARKQVRTTVRTCDLPAGHAGPHITDDAEGRPEYYWRRDDA